MGAEIFTDEWARAWCEEINRSEGYARAAADWTDPLALVMQRDPSQGLEEDRAVYVDLRHGECREARSGRESDLETAPYIITADPYTWRQVLDGQLEPIVGLMRGRLKLTRGNLLTLARYVTAARELVAAATRVDTTFPEGPS